MPIAVSDAAQQRGRHVRRARSETEGEHHRVVDDLQSNEVVPFVVASVVQQKSVLLSGRETEKWSGSV